MKRLVLVLVALLAVSSEFLASLDVVGGSPPGCC